MTVGQGPRGWAPLSTVALLTGLVLLPRLLVFGVNENLFGDAVARAELGERWALNPRLIGSFDQGAYQFGPLHLYLLGVLAWLGGERESIGRWLSVVTTALTVWPLYALTVRLFDRRAAIVACLGFACWGMQIQFATTASSEALGLALTVATVALFARAVGESHRPSLLAAALVLNLGCATRYDLWLWIPLLTLVLAAAGRWRWAALFFALCLAFPLGWSWGNWLDRGDPLFPFRFIDDFHRQWFPEAEKLWGATSYRLQNLVFWPWIALLTLSPVIALAGMLGLWRAWRTQPATRWLVALVLVPTALFTFRSTVTGSFVPLGRFAVKEVALLLPFVWAGLCWEPLRRVRTGVVAVGAVLALALPTAIGLFTLHRDGKYEDWLRPVSPTSTNSRALMEVARFLSSEVNARGEAAILDRDDAQYRDLILAFYSGLPEERLARHRWEVFPARLVSAQPRFLVRIEGGTLERLAQLGTRSLRFNAWDFVELDGFSPPFHVYRRD